MEIQVKITPEMNRVPDIIYTETKKSRFEAKKYAPLDPKTKRIKARLAKRLAELDKKMTEAALVQTRNKIYAWIARHSAHRIPVQKNSVNLFSGGKSSAPLSKKIENLRLKIEKEHNQQEEHVIRTLAGRVSRTS